MGKRSADDRGRSEEIHADDPFPVVAGDLVQAAANVGSGARDEAAKAAIELCRSLDRTRSRRGVGEVDQFVRDAVVRTSKVEDEGMSPCVRDGGDDGRAEPG
jgi:hypothetical protein